MIILIQFLNVLL